MLGLHLSMTSPLTGWSVHDIDLFCHYTVCGIPMQMQGMPSSLTIVEGVLQLSQSALEAYSLS